MFLKLNTHLEMSSLLDLSMESLWVGSSLFSFLPSLPLEKWNIYLHTTQVRCNSIPFLSCSTYQPCATIKKNYERKRTKYFLKEICSGHRIAGGDSLCFLLFLYLHSRKSSSGSLLLQYACFSKLIPG